MQNAEHLREQDENQNMISCFAHEAEMNRMERMNKRLLYLVIAVLSVALVLFVLNNFLWMNHLENERAAMERIMEAYETNPGIHEQSD